MRTRDICYGAEVVATLRDLLQQRVLQMRIFISSLISGFEPFRNAARSAVRSLGHEPVVAEDFGAMAASPQVACLQGLRSADLVVLMLGERYGTVPPGSKC